MVYDARLIPPLVLGDVTAILDEKLQSVVSAILGRELSDDEWLRIRLDGPFDGFSCRSPLDDCFAVCPAADVKLKTGREQSGGRLRLP